MADCRIFSQYGILKGIYWTLQSLIESPLNNETWDNTLLYTWAPQAKILRYQNTTKRILPYKINAANKKTLRFQSATNGDYPLQNERRRRKFRIFRALLRRFYLTKWMPQAIFQFQSATKGILPCKIDTAHNFCPQKERPPQFRTVGSVASYSDIGSKAEIN